MPTLETNAHTLRAAIAKVLHASADDEARPVLASVMIEGDAKGVRAVATDNHRIAIATFDHEPSEFGQVILWRRDIPLILSLLGGLRTANVTLTVADGKATIAGGSLSVSVGTYDGRFPEYKSVITFEDDGRVALGVQARFLIDAAKALKGEPNMVIKVGKSEQPILISGPDYLEVVMPLRLYAPAIPKLKHRPAKRAAAATVAVPA